MRGKEDNDPSYHHKAHVNISMIVILAKKNIMVITDIKVGFKMLKVGEYRQAEPPTINFSVNRVVLE